MKFILPLRVGFLVHSINGFMTPKASFSTLETISTTSKTSKFQLQETTIDNSDSITHDDQINVDDPTAITQRRALGSQELLMLPRQYGPHLEAAPSNQPFPQMSHISTILLSATPSIETLSKAIDEAMESHPLLRCYVEGDGEPDRRIDAFQMVREGDPNPCTFVCPSWEESGFSHENVLTTIDVIDENDGSDDLTPLESSWQKAFATNLDSGDNWCHVNQGPLWKVELHRQAKGGDKDLPCALVFTFNHAISDQSSANMLMDQILSNMASIEEHGGIQNKAVKQTIPVSMEESVLGMKQSFSDVQTDGMSLNTATYVAGKAAEGFRSPVILPDDKQTDGNGILGAMTIISGKAPGGESDEERKSTVQFRSLSESTMKALLGKCKENAVTLSNVLSAAMAYTATDFISNGTNNKNEERNYKVLQSLDMRRFGSKLDNCDTVACMAGSHDLMLGPLPDNSGEKMRKSSSPDKETKFWELVKDSKLQTKEFIDSNGPQEATRVFDFAMTISDMNNLVNLAAQSTESRGRAYSAGIVNAGIYERQQAVQRDDDSKSRNNLNSEHGRYKVDGVYFATSHARSGCLYQASCLTVNNQLECTFHPAKPIVDETTNSDFADAYIELLQTLSGENIAALEESNSHEETNLSKFKSVPTLAASLFGLVGLGIHSNGWTNFFSSVMEMKEAIADPEEFWAALNFWIFFAVGHPILQPILWISDVLHGTPGPLVANLVPALFILGNVAVIALISASKEIRNAVNIFALSAFLTYIGAGLDGQAGLGDYNLALGKGCPTYEEVRQPSMDNFDINKYEGFWYEHKFHDWTQFKEVYDTTLDIKLTADGKGWIDDFAVKGPAPDSARLSWDKSPVANGAHYFLFGRIDENDSTGVLREKGFGVEFPNYIVDVQTNPETGEYVEAIQFQCLERGGIRVFEGINFMSRNPSMTESETAAMHNRAKLAGMYPYGASPEEMHTVARRDITAPKIDNSWQAMWRAIGVDQLLELLTKSIEDGGR